MSGRVLRQVALYDPQRLRRMLTPRPHITRQFWPPHAGWCWRCDNGICVGISSISPGDAYRHWLHQIWRLR
ncbi:MAG: hypothetical protein EBR82_09800 [Caulobacteraceae bacterium]|nr:hypothetical protein [Caulobacteraceae bacterium]